jgi:UDP-galactopyranose mutase
VASSRPRVAATTVPGAASRPAKRPPLICFSHLRWDFVFQRPQHLMSRFAKHGPVYFFEEPLCRDDVKLPTLELRLDKANGVTIVTPQLPAGLCRTASSDTVKSLLDQFVAEKGIRKPIAWYYTPEMYPFSKHLACSAVVYDCMDELANFRFANPQLPILERELMRRADIVFTGGHSLYEAKRGKHDNIHPFPSSVDRAHFAQARKTLPEPADQKALPRPRLGYYGVIDERMDLELLAALADAHPEWSIVMVGPVVKVSFDELPKRANIHYLGGKTYAELPAYLAGWDGALMPFAICEATRFISPTKTPEYLAGGCPVVSTPITDVVRHYGALAAVAIGETAQDFVRGCESAIDSSGEALAKPDWLKAADAVLSELSWDTTFARMKALIDAAIVKRIAPPNNRAPAPSPLSAVLSADLSAAARSAQAEARSVKAEAAAIARAVDADAGKARLASPAIRPATRRKPFDDLIVGAGFAGAVLAERLACGSGRRVLLIDRRPHIGGNAYDRHDAAGLLIHQYGPHIFHTNSEQIFRYLSRFTQWRPYEHRVLASVGGRLMPIPINRTTINTLYGLSLDSDEQAAAFFAERAEPTAAIQTSEDVVVAAVGRELYETFFRGYTRKQWGLDPSELDKQVTSRVPTRTNTDDRYFGDEFQCMPLHGYTRMFENMLDHPNIAIELNADYADLGDETVYERLIYTGPIDEYFDYRYGRLPYRCLSFTHKTLDQEWFQPVAVVNYPSEDVPYTRITEYKHLTGQTSSRTSITYEYPSGTGDPYYPVPRPENQALYKKYEALAQASREIFVGRLATYRYYNMDQVVGQALATYRRLSEAKTRLPLSEPLRAEA